ncbi:UNVERIFIED_CONTAM: Beta-amylase 2, chloroplastic [Sesamum latifolium]|uniref:Beta-amylase n=1 Tax=Sesamum latifolium TaxID=2727402 RepID=A0AAW2YGE6_9LAMI
MAVNIRFSLGARNSAASLPIISATVDRGRRSAGKRCSCKLRSVLVKSCAPSRAAVGGGGEKFAEQDGSLRGIASWNQEEEECDLGAERYAEVTEVRLGCHSGKVTGSIIPQVQERDFTNTPYVPVYVMLPLGTINMECKLVDPRGLINQLRILKSINVDGVMVDCWWGIVEARGPRQYNWGGYKRLFKIVRALKLKLQVYFDYMRSFRVEFEEFFRMESSLIEIGLVHVGLRYPSYPAKHDWKISGYWEFQCYDKYLMKSFEKITEARVNQFWGKQPEGVGCYNSKPHETTFFCDGGAYDSYYGRFFLNWYSQLSGIHWWYKTASHAAELTAGFYNSANRDGYAPIALMLKKHKTTLNFTCVELRTLDQYEEFPEALADPEGLVWQVLNAAWDAGIHVASENALPCYDRQGFNKILQNAKPYGDPDKRHLSAFTYLRLSPDLMEEHNLMEFERFVKQMHGKNYTLS